MSSSAYKIRSGIATLPVFIASIILAGCLACSARGQEPAATPKPVPPSGPLLNPAPEFSKWIITFSYPEDAAKSERALRPSSPRDATRRVVTTKTRDIIHEEIIDVSGGRSEKWQVGETFYRFPPGQDYWAAYDPDYQMVNKHEDIAFSALPKGGFRGLEWLKPEAYAGSIKQSNAAYLVFIPVGASKVDVNDLKTLEEQPTIAYVDAASRLPVLFKKDGVTQTYSFLAAPSAMLTLPADLAKAIQDGNEARAKVFGAPHAE